MESLLQKDQLKRKKQEKQCQITKNFSKSTNNKLLIIDHQRIHKIQLRTLQILSKYFDNVTLQKKQQAYKTTHNSHKSKQLYQSGYFGQNYDKIHDRFCSLPSQNNQKIKNDMIQMKEVYNSLEQNRKKLKLKQKLNKVKQSSQNLSKQLFQHQKQIIQRLKNLNCQGNEWVQLNKNTNIKKQWRKRNKSQADKQKAGLNAEFFIRKPTTNYKIQKQRILQRIQKLNIKHRSLSMNNFPSIVFQKENNLLHLQERSNKLMQKSRKGIKISKNKDKIQNELKPTDKMSKSQSLGFGIKSIDSNIIKKEYKNSPRVINPVLNKNKLSIRQRKVEQNIGLDRNYNHKFIQLLKENRFLSNSNKKYQPGAANNKLNTPIISKQKHQVKFKLFKQNKNIKQRKALIL